MTSYKDIISDNENVVAENNGVFLTTDRVFSIKDSTFNTSYKDIQLSNLDSFEHTSDFNTQIAALGVLTIFLGSYIAREMVTQAAIIGGLALFIYAIATYSKEYRINSNSGVSVSLKGVSDPFSFFQTVNDEKNR